MNEPCSRRIADIYGTGQIPEFGDIVDTFLAWHEEILGWHHTGRPSNGRIEGTNNLLQVLRRKAHGFTNHAYFEAEASSPHNLTPSGPAAPSHNTAKAQNA